MEELFYQHLLRWEDVDAIIHIHGIDAIMCGLMQQHPCITAPALHILIYPMRHEFGTADMLRRV